MQLLADYFPLILFFIAFKWQGIMVATGVAIAASIAQIAWFHWKGKLSVVHWLSFGIIVVFGGATLILQDETFIKWKPTVLYWLAGVVFLGGLAFRQNLVKAVMSEGGLELPEPVWTKLCVAWGVFFLFKGTLNLWVAYTFPTDVWVNFKLFGGMGLMIAFVVAQALWLSKFVPEEPAKPQAKGEGN